MFDWQKFFDDFAEKYYSVPNFDNKEHVYALQNYLINKDMVTEDVDFAIKTLLGEAPKKPEDIDPDTPVKYTIKDKDGKDVQKTTTYKSAIKRDKDSPAFKAAEKLRGDGKQDKPEKLDSPKDPALAGDREADNNADTTRKTDKKTIKSKEDFQELELNDRKFEKQNKKNQTKTPYELPSEISENPKYPKKYQKLLTRMLNTEVNAKDDTKNLGYFMGEGKAGLGGSEANIGELMTMMSTTMRDKEATKFFQSIEEHLARVKQDGQKIHVGAQWVKAAKENRSISLRMFRDKYGNGYEIEDSAWDIAEEVEKMGMDYGDKGASTDVFFKVKTPDGKSTFQEISLKQSLTGTNLHNGAVGATFGRDYDYPDSINPKIYTENQAQNHDNYIIGNQANVRTFIEDVDTGSPEFDKRLDKIAGIMGSNKPNNVNLVKIQLMDFLKTAKEDLLSNPNLDIDRDYLGNTTQLGKGKFTKEIKVVNKVMTALARLQAEYGDTGAQAHVDNLVNESKQTATNTAVHIGQSNEARDRVLKSIQEKLPLKSVADGDEDIVMGQTGLTQKTLKMVFGTDDWDNIKQNLEVDSLQSPPLLKYSGEIRGKKESIPIANLIIREDGIGYKGAHRFIMKLDTKFGKRIESASQEIYSDQETLDTPVGRMRGREPV